MLVTLETDRQSDSQTVRQSVSQSDKQAVRQTDRQTGRQTDCRHSLVDMLINFERFNSGL
jgi:hypothetical protein